MDFGVCDKFALIVVGATFSPGFSLLFILFYLLLTSLSAARSG